MAKIIYYSQELWHGPAVKGLAGKPVNLRLVPRTHMIEWESKLYNFFFDLYIYTMAQAEMPTYTHVCAYIHIHTHTER